MNDDLIEESIRIRKQTETLIKIIYVILIITIIAYSILILLKLGVI